MINSEWNTISTIPEDKEVFLKLINDAIVIGCVDCDGIFFNENLLIEHFNDLDESEALDQDEDGYSISIKTEIIGWKEIPKDWLL